MQSCRIFIFIGRLFISVYEIVIELTGIFLIVVLADDTFFQYRFRRQRIVLEQDVSIRDDIVLHIPGLSVFIENDTGLRNTCVVYR